MPPDVTGALTLDREQEIHDGRGDPATPEELELVERSAALMSAWFQKDREKLAEVGRKAKAVVGIVGCGTHEVVQRHGKDYGTLTVGDVLEQGDRGLRGREALDAALAAGPTVVIADGLDCKSSGDLCVVCFARGGRMHDAAALAGLSHPADYRPTTTHRT